jgi:hypothetical protein
MIWPAMVFNLCVGLLFAGFLLHAVRRFERRADALMAELDRRHEQRMRKLDAERDEVLASLRARTDRSIAKVQANAETNAETSAYGSVIGSTDHNGLAHQPHPSETSSTDT